MQSQGPAALVSWIVIVIGSIVLHELAHGWAAIRFGDRTPIDLGHMTWNPLVHMGVVSLVCFAVIGIAWGAMPVDPTRMRGRFSMALTLLAGPAMNVALWGAAVVLGPVWDGLAPMLGLSDTLIGNVSAFLFYGALLNAALAVFNMIPIPPLDGGRIAAELVPAFRALAEGETGRWVLLGAFILLFRFAGGVIFELAAVATVAGRGAVELMLSMVI